MKRPNFRFVLTAVLCAAALLTVFSSFGFAQGSFTLEQVMSSPFPDQLTTAKHANRIAWVFNAKGVRNVWVADAPNFAARQVTHYTDDGTPIASLRLTPDGSTVVYVRGSETNPQGEVADPTSNVKQPHQQVFAMNADGSGEPRLLGTVECNEEGCEDVQISPDGTRAVWSARKQLWIAPISGAEQAKQLAYLRGNNMEPKWSPDGREVAFVSDRGDHALVGVYDFDKQTILWLAPSTNRDHAPRWSPDGKQVAFMRVHGVEGKLPMIPLRPEPWAIWVADAQTGIGHEVWHSGTDLKSSISFYADEDFHWMGNRLLFGSEQDGWNHLYSIPVQGGRELLLTPGQFEVEQVDVAPDEQTIYYTSNQNDIDRRHIWKVSVFGGAPAQVTSGTTSEWSPQILRDERTLVALGSSGTTPAMPYLITSQGRQMLAKDQLPADFPSAQLVEPQQVIYKSADGWNIHGQLFVPRQHAAKAPALVFIHGGSIRQMILGFHYMNYYHNAYAENQYLASLGYVVLSINYRTGTMYGRAFREPANGGWRGGAEYQDLYAAGRYLQSLSYVDSQKIGLWGGSYGGYMTAMGLARNSDLFKAGVDLHGVHDWSVFLAHWGELTGARSAGTPPDYEQAVKLAFESSPNASVDKWRSPVLLIQGDDDRNVPFSQTVDLAEQLRDRKVPFEEIVFPDEIHDFLRWSSWMHAYAAAADFFDRTLVKDEQIGVGVIDQKFEEH